MSVQRNRDDEHLACQYRGRINDVRVMHAVAPDTHSGKTYPSHGSVALAVRIARGKVLPARDLLQNLERAVQVRPPPNRYVHVADGDGRQREL